jgi:hypothetical protein
MTAFIIFAIVMYHRKQSVIVIIRSFACCIRVYLLRVDHMPDGDVVNMSVMVRLYYCNGIQI